MRKKTWMTMWLLAPAMAGFPLSAKARELPASFSLGRCVPENVWLYIHAVDNPERAWIEQQWAGVWQALKNTGIDRDITGLIYSAMSAEDRAKAESAVNKAMELIGAVKWGDLIGREMVFAERWGPLPVGVEYLLLAHGTAGSGEANFAALTAILKEIASLSEALNVGERKSNDVDIRGINIIRDPSTGETIFSFSLFRRADVIGLAFGRGIVDEVIKLMSADKTDGSIVASPRFQNAARQVPAPSDALTYFDARAMFGGVSEMLKTAAAGMAPQGAEPRDDQKAMAVFQKLIRAFDVIDYTIATVETRGRRQHSHSLVRMQEGKENSPLAQTFLKRKPFERFDEYIPADATGFSVSTFVDLEGLYEFVLKFIREDVPGGGQAIEQWKSFLSSVNFDPKSQIFDWLSGEMINVTMPAAVVTPMGGADSVHLIRVKNSELAASRVNALLDFLSARLQAQGQMLMLSPAQVSAPGFREVTNPMLAMFLRPVVGVHKEWLIIGTSAGAVDRCLKVAAGEAPSVRQNKRFMEEGLVPKGPAHSVSFMDTSKLGQELGQAVGMAGFVGGMISGTMQGGGPEMEKAKANMQKVMNIVMKLGPVLQKIDFYSSQSAVSTYDGKLDIRYESVVTYKQSASSGQAAE